MKLIFERSRPGRGNGLLPSLDVPAAPLPEKYRRKTVPRLPELGERDLSRHYQASPAGPSACATASTPWVPVP